MRRVAVAAVFLAILATGCRLDAALRLDVRSDGSAGVIGEVVVDDELRDLLAGLGVDPEEALTRLVAEAEEEMNVTVETGEDETAFRTTFDVQSIEEDVARLAGGGGPFETLDVRVGDDGAVIRARTRAGLTEPLEGAAPVDVGNIADFVTAQLEVRLPGRVISHNADAVEADGTLVWNLPLSGEAVDIEAESTTRLSPAVWIGLGVVLVGAAMAVVLVRSRGRRRTATVVEPAEPVPEIRGFGSDEG